MKTTSFAILMASLLGMGALAAQAIAGTPKETLVSKAHASIPVITDPWARATVPGQPVGAIYMNIESPVNSILLEAQIDVARAVAVHDMHQHEGVMQMREHGPLELPKGTLVKLAPGGTHFMLLGLKRPLNPGETLRLKMTFGSSANDKDQKTLLVNVPVRPFGQ